MSNKPPVPPLQAHAMAYRVCYADTDRMQRVYYGTYLAFCERARTEMLRASGWPYKELESAGVLLPVRSCAIRYWDWADYDDLLTLRTWVSTLRHATVAFTTTIHREDDPRVLVAATVELACITPDGRPRAFDKPLAEALTALFVPESGL